MTNPPRLLVALTEATRAAPFARKLLVCQTPAQGRELLRAAAASGEAWIGWESTTLRKLAHELVAVEIAAAGETVADEFDLLSLMDAAIDAVRDRGAAGPFGTGGASGYRDAIRRAVEQLRSAGIGPEHVHRTRCADDGKLAALAEILAEYERGLRAARLVDGPGVLERAVAALEQGRAELPDARLFLLPGHPLRGLAGRFVRLLLGSGRVRELAGDAVVRLPAPAGVTCPAADAVSGPLSYLHSPEDAPERPQVELFAAATPVDELREVLRRVIARDVPWDQVEIVATDPMTYGAAMDTLARRIGVPVTYSEGLDSRRTRVGRAMEAYFRWITEGFPADVLRGMLESGDLAAPDEITDVSAAALARRLRRLRIGWGRARYLEAIDQALRAAEESRPRDGEVEAEEAAAMREREIRELYVLRALLDAILSATPHLPDRARSGTVRTSPGAVARGALKFLRFVPAGDAAENAVRSVVGERLARAAATLTRETRWESAVNILRARLETRAMPAGETGLTPWTSTAGHLHLSDLNTGGLACRPHIFVVGLDAGRVSGTGGTDPLLTESDRQLLNGSVAPSPLPAASERIEEARFRLASVLARLRGGITLSYSAWDVAEGRAVSPAPELLQAHRLRAGDATLTYADLRRSMGALACAVPAGESLAEESDVWLAAIADGRVLRLGEQAVRSVFADLDRGLHAREQRERDEATAHHGRIEPRPELDPRAQEGAVFSATRLETLGSCPRRFFYRYVLGVSPTRDPEWDPESWLDALERGSLLHAVYERTLRECRARGVEYPDEQFAVHAQVVLDEEIGRTVSRCPPPSPAVFDAECQALREDVHAFVAMIRRDRPDWVDLELAFGPGKQEVAIAVGRGEVRLQGAIDRIDRVDGRLRIVDYKTGGADWYREAQPFKGGRRVQHVLYTLAAQQLLGEEVTSMEYHFPTRRGETRVVPYPAERLERGAEVLETLFAIAADGHFLPTDDANDCKYCDFSPVCRASVNDYGGVSCAAVDWVKETGVNQPEYVRLNALREIDG